MVPCLAGFAVCRNGEKENDRKETAGKKREIRPFSCFVEISTWQRYLCRVPNQNIHGKDIVAMFHPSFEHGKCFTSKYYRLGSFAQEKLEGISYAREKRD
jgi:hypothetical protein